MNQIKFVVIVILLIIGSLSFSVAEEIKTPAEKVQALMVDPATGKKTDLVFNKKSHRWEVPISSAERAINPSAVNMPDSFFIRDPKTGNDYPVRWERYHEYVWETDDKSSDLKNPSVEFIAGYYPPGKIPNEAKYVRQEAAGKSQKGPDDSQTAQNSEKKYGPGSDSGYKRPPSTPTVRKSTS